MILVRKKPTPVYPLFSSYNFSLKLTIVTSKSLQNRDTNLQNSARRLFYLLSRKDEIGKDKEDLGMADLQKCD